MKRHRLGPWLASTLFIACVPVESEYKSTDQNGEIQESSPLALVFADAAQAWQVPADLLKAAAYVETQFEPADGHTEFEGQPAPWGLFNLRGEELERAATLSGYSLHMVQTDESAGIHAAAALLSQYADEADIAPEDRTDPTNWGPAVGRLGGIDDPDLQNRHAQSILGWILRGAQIPLMDGTTLVIGRHGSDDQIQDELRAEGTVWRPSPNFNSRGSARPQFVVIHTCEGSYGGCVSWLRNRESGVSAHYVVNENGSEISQLVDEDNRAWHVGARYRSSLNSGRLPHLDGLSSNTYSIGIEHGGRASQPSWSQGLIEASAELVRGITERHNIPQDRYHIVAHGQLQPESRVDPGPNWPWNAYLEQIRGDDPGTSPVLTVDNETPGRFRASANWGTSSWAAGRIGQNYHFRGPEGTSDPAEYKVAIAEAGTYEVFARVPGNGYNTKAPFIIYHQGGRSVVHRNLSSNGLGWMSLGTFDFDAKDDWIVQLSCWTNGTGFLIADAIRFERR